VRVLHVVFSLDAGGMENGVVNVSRALEQRGFEFHACCLSRAGKFAERFPNPGRVHVLGKTEGFSLRTIRALAACIRGVAPDVIHTHNFGPLIYTALAAPGRKNRILHGEHAELTPAELAPRRKLLRKFLYHRVARVHAVSPSLRDKLISQGFPAKKIRLVVNGVDCAQFVPGPRGEARAATGLPPEAVVLGLVGRFGEFKRHTEMIAAFERLPADGRDLRLVFIGSGGPLESSVRERAAASPCASRIQIAGFQEDPRPWYRSLDLLVLPSVNEGLSNALLEAMACGVPALAHAACGNADVITDSANGFLRDLGSPEALDIALAEALRSPNRLPALGQAARATAEAGFSIEATVAGYERLYRDLAGKSSPG